MEQSKNSLEDFKKSVDATLYRIKKDKTLNSEYIDNYVVKLLEKAVSSCIEERHKVESCEDGKETVMAIHYTSVNALVSMIQNASGRDNKDSLRLYDSVHLNDPDEGNYINRNLPENYDWPKKKEVSHAYIASFITPDPKKDMSDNLVFWRTYGKEGKGCSLLLPVPRNRLRRVRYGRDAVLDTMKLLDPIFDYLKPLVKILNPSAGNDILSKLSGVVWKSLEGVRYLYKSEAYEYEEECRIVATELDIIDKGKIYFESTDQNDSSEYIRHYYVDKGLAIEKLLITDSFITLGPCVYNSYNIRYYLETILKRANLHGPKIRISKIPYRKS